MPQTYNDRATAQVQQIGAIQRALLPERIPDIPGLNIATSYETFDHAGGDFYDFLPLRNLGANGDARWLLVIGDVSGHGPAAAVVMAMFQAILHAYPRVPAGPGEILEHLNRHLCAKRIEQSFVTAFIGLYDPSTRRLTYASAGHHPPILKEFPHRGRPDLLDKAGELPLGIDPDVCYSQASTLLHKGQTLILYTDGVIEARKPRGELFGVTGIEHALIACSGSPPCAIGHITEALKTHQLGVRPADDQTVIALQVV